MLLSDLLVLLPGLMQVLFWGALAVVLYTYALYPLIAALMARMRPRAWLRGDAAFAVSLIMPVHNGASILQAKMDHLLALDSRIIRQIIVISDGSTDGTAEKLEEFRDPRLKVLQLTQQVGKAEALNQAMLKAEHELIVFVDIRPRLEETALRALISNFTDRSVGCAAGELVVRSSDAHDSTVNHVGGMYWRYEQWIRTSESRWSSPVGVYGGFYAVRRRLTRPFPSGLILDDMFQPLSIIRQGYRNVLDRSAVVVDTWPATTRGEFQRKVRTLAGNFQLVKAAPWLLSGENRVRFQFVSHKLLRLVVPYALLAMVLSSAVLSFGSRIWMAVGMVQVLFWALAALSLRVRITILHRLLGPAGALLVLNAAAVMALYTFLFTRGPLWKIWSPTPVLAGNRGAVWGEQQTS